MYIKVVDKRDAASLLYPAFPGKLEYGVRFLYEHPFGEQAGEAWLPSLGFYQDCYFLIPADAAPTGHREFFDPENHPDEHGKPWWVVNWVLFDDGTPGGDGLVPAMGRTRVLLVTMSDVYILGDNGKTIDKVR